MKRAFYLFTLLFCIVVQAQTNPVITSWIQNTTGITGRHYVEGNSTPIDDAVEANVQIVQYSDDWVYVSATGIPAYITGPFMDGNPSLATDQNAIYKFPLTPTQNTGTPTATTAGNIGVFINGVSLFDYRDGVAWNPNTNSICGGPGNPPCPGGPMTENDWNRDAIPAENAGFDCAKAHPAMGNYHHHQNPSAFNLDLVEISNICDTYPADGLYVINPSVHSPLIGFAYDGFPIYGAMGYANADGTGDITRIKSSYELSENTTRANGPDVDETYFNGYFREDYQYVAHNDDDSYLDEHNGRFCVTPEYPEGTYAYFCTVDENYNSAYPYAVGPTFYGNVVTENVTTIGEDTTVYESTLRVGTIEDKDLNILIYPNPSSEFITIQAPMAEGFSRKVALINELGQVVKSSQIVQGSTLCNLEIDTVYDGVYFIKVSSGTNSKSYKVIIKK
ncbi:YHYH protein [Flavobacterium arcticum]|uniref:YHYH protein n=1 Tax=Flavobacterium arcticum TaxID=1784713 RepID=A0A345HCQ5_9FLAO|nr:YHYH protein [Flavobacterium arcticum]AXG74365.1 YHYH protein [Flavobacterium arcticum]KAF2507520.1 YHYH protein [Flavobacterium arcticum]